jgi:signal transduction histidine kinase
VIEAPVSRGAAVDAPLDVRYEGVATPTGTFTVVAASPLGGVESSISTLKRVLWIGLPFLVALVGAIAWFVTGRALRPVDAMRADVDAITAKTIDRRLPEPASGDELARLAHTMNSMLDRLERASVKQRQFVSDASHELRSPVAAMRAELEVGLRAGGEADWPRIAGDVLAEEARLELLIDDLLLLAAADEQGVASAQPARVDLGALIRTDAARARAVPVSVDLPESLTVHGVADRLARVFANLLDNAARFASTSVAVTAEHADEAVVVHVDDDGPGIPADDRERVFERFTRLDGSRARPAGGAGLGLALARAIVERHYGSITAGESPLGGARLTVTLPTTLP